MQFEKLCDRDFNRIAQLQEKTKYDGSEYSMLYLKGWDFFNYESMEICDTEDIIFLRFQPHDRYKEDIHDGKYIYLPPLCAVENIAKAYEEIESQCADDAEEMYVMSTPKNYVDILGDKYTYLHNEDYDEYLYLPQDLITLAGKKYHSKRNHIKKFTKKDLCRKKRQVAYSEVTKKAIGKRYLRLSTDGKRAKNLTKEEFDGLANDELNVIALALKLVENNSNYFADIVEYKNKIIGFSLGEITPSGIGITHIEKGDVNYDGIYSLSLQLLLQKNILQT